MYPKNAASPNQVAIGAVVQISDGAVQTSGCTVRILPQGGAEGDGGGTTAYSTDGIVLYTPTQAETNYASFILIAKKASCIPVAITVVTTDSATAGRVNVSHVAGTAQTAGDLAALVTVIDGIVDDILVDTGTTLQGELDGIQADTEDLQTQIGTAGAGLTAILGRLISLALTTGAVVADAGNTASSFQTNLAGADDYWNDCLILITSGDLAGQVKEIGDFADVDGVVTLTSGQAFTGVPAGDVTFVIINR